MLPKTRRALDRFLADHPLPIQLRELLVAVVEGERDDVLAVSVGSREQLALLEDRFYAAAAMTVYAAALAIHLESLRPPSLRA